MERLSLRAMTVDEFDVFLARSVRGFAAEQVVSGKWSAEEAEARAVEQTNLLLPQGLDTPGMLLLVAENIDGIKIGHLWVTLQATPGSGVGAWIYYIEIEPEHRGKGYGSALMLAAEQEVALHGVSTIGMNVFGWNSIARSLYEKAGYQIMTMQLRKEITTLPSQGAGRAKL